MLLGHRADGFGNRAVVAAHKAVHFVIQNQFLGQVRSQGRICLMIFEDKRDFGATHAFNAAVFSHTHIDISHNIVGNFGRQLRTGPQFAAGRRGTAGQRVNDTDLDFLFSQRPRGYDEADD